MTLLQHAGEFPKIIKNMTHEETTAALAQALARVEQLAADLATANAAITALNNFKAAMLAGVTAALADGDQATLQGIAQAFIQPEADRIRAEKLAQLEALKTELGL